MLLTDPGAYCSPSAQHAVRQARVHRKVRVVVDWTLALLLKREVVSLGQLHEPRAEFVHLASEDAEQPVGVR